MWICRCYYVFNYPSSVNIHRFITLTRFSKGFEFRRCEQTDAIPFRKLYPIRPVATYLTFRIYRWPCFRRCASLSLRNIARQFQHFTQHLRRRHSTGPISISVHESPAFLSQLGHPRPASPSLCGNKEARANSPLLFVLLEIAPLYRNACIAKGKRY